MTVPKHSQTSPSSAGDLPLISPVSSTSSHPSTSTHSHASGSGSGRLPGPPPADRLPPPKARSAGPGQSQRFTLRRKDKDKDKDKRKPIPSPSDEVEEDWTMEGTTTTTTGTDRRHGHDVLISPPSKEDLRTAPIRLEEPVDLFDSQLTEVPSKEMEKKKSRGRGLVKKTSKLFLRGDRDKDKDISASLAPRPSERQQSYSSATSNDSAITSASSSNASIQMASVTRAPPPSGHSRRLSHDSQFSWQGGQSIRSSTSASQPTGMETRRMSNSNNLSASVPALSRNSLPQPGQSSRGPETIPSRMSSWFTNLLPSTSSATIFESPASQDQHPTTSSPARKGPSAAASFLYAARQKAVDGVRNLLDSEAQPDKSPDTIWVMGVGHPGYRPSSPFDSPNTSASDLPTVIEGQGKRRGSSSSGTSMNVASPSFKADQAALRPAVWPKRRDPLQATSPSSKGIGNLFSASSLSLALPTSSPQKDLNQLDSPGKGKRKDREIIKWPEQFHADFRSRIWCTYRSQYAPIVSLSPELLIPTPKAYYSAFTSPMDVIGDSPHSTSIGSTSLPNRPSTSAWGWTRNGEERGLTSDAGWGCMLRTGQSMLANALVHLHLGREWRMPLTKPEDPAELEDFATHIRILSWFFDDPSPLCPFSVHRMALIGKELGKEVGEWFGPSTAAGALKTLANSFPPCGISVVSATDSMIYKSDVYSASSLSSTGWFEDDSGKSGTTSKRSSSERGRVWGDKAVLVLVGLRLGLDGVNPIYYESIKALFTFPQSVGIAGGRPSSSYYFIGTQGDSLFYLDPHFTRPAVPLKTPPAPASRTPLRPHWQKPNSHNQVEVEVEEEDIEIIKPLTTYSLDEVDIDDLSDTSSVTSSPTNRVRRSTIRPINTGTSTDSQDDTKHTPPGSPTRAPESPTTPLAPSPSRADTINSTDPTPMAPPPERTRSRSDTESAPPPAPATATAPAQDTASESTKWFASAYTEAQLRTFHCDKIKKIPLSNVDPSMLLGFLCKNEADFEDFCQRVSKMPKKIFTVQDEPPTWDDNDDPGMESVSDVSSGSHSKSTISRSNSHEHVPPPPPPPPPEEPIEEEKEEQETLQDEYTTTTLNAIEIENDSQRVGAMKESAILSAERDLGGTEEEGNGIGIKPRPPKPRPLQSLGPVGTDSWIRPVKGGEAAPNGRSVV